MNVNRWPLAAVICLVVACGPVGTTPTPEWAQCRPNAPLACSTLAGVPLGRWRGSMSLETPPCDDCRDLLGVARSALERVDHPPVTAIELFDPDPFVLCRDVGAACGGGPDLGIFVFTFGDDTTLPIVVSCPITAGSVCQRVDHYGPPYG
jgi:hypothetical protein